MSRVKVSKNNARGRWMHMDNITGDWKSGRVNTAIRRRGRMYGSVNKME